MYGRNLAAVSADGLNTGSDVVAGAIATAVRHGAQWFPHLNGKQLTVRLVGRRQDRPRSLLARLQLHDGRQEASVVVKARAKRPTACVSGRSGLRPILVPPELLTDLAMARHEYDGLSMISAGFGDSDRTRFGIARPLAWLPEHAAFVMDHVSDQTLRQRLMANSRLRPGGARLNVASLVNAGAWLRIYHGLRPAGVLQSRLGQRTQVIELFEQYAKFLAGRAGHTSLLTALARSGSARADAALLGELPLAVGHGDFVARNLFESVSGRITVIDPMPRWLVPPYEDVARFIVGMRLLGMQIITQGMAFGQQELDAYEDAFVRGYFGEDPVPREALHVYHLLILMDKWSAAQQPAPRRTARGLVQMANQRWSDAYFRQEALRLLSRLGCVT